MSKLKRNRVYRLPLLLRNEMNIPLRGPPVQMTHKPGNLVPGFSLGHQDRNERVSQSMNPIQSLEFRPLHKLLKKSVSSITPTLLNCPLAPVLPTGIDARVIERIKDRKQDLGLLGQRLDVLLEQLVN